MTHPNSIRAVLFDMDGTLVDNMPFHAEAWVEMSRKQGVAVTPERIYALSGRTNEEFLPVLLERALTPEQIAAMVQEKELLYRELYASKMELMPGLGDFLDRLSAAGVRLGLASAAPPQNIDLVLDGLELRRRFGAVVGAEHVQRGKPAPDIFLASAAALGIDPKNCLAFEDAVNGVKSARSAGMVVAGITSVASDELLRQAGAQWTMRDYRGLPAELAERIWSPTRAPEAGRGRRG